MVLVNAMFREGQISNFSTKKHLTVYFAVVSILTVKTTGSHNHDTEETTPTFSIPGRFFNEIVPVRSSQRYPSSTYPSMRSRNQHESSSRHGHLPKLRNLGGSSKNLGDHHLTKGLPPYGQETSLDSPHSKKNHFSGHSRLTFQAGHNSHRRKNDHQPFLNEDAETLQDEDELTIVDERFGRVRGTIGSLQNELKYLTSSTSSSTSEPISSEEYNGLVRQPRSRGVHPTVMNLRLSEEDGISLLDEDEPPDPNDEFRNSKYI